MPRPTPRASTTPVSWLPSLPPPRPPRRSAPLRLDDEVMSDLFAAGPHDHETSLPDWSEDEVVQLHWRLLLEVSQLADPATPLEEKLDTLHWVFTERDKDGLPFSFANCLRVVGCSPLSPIAYCGRVDPEDIRARIRQGLKAWLSETLSRYPIWVRQAISANPQWAEQQVLRNPQWINEQVRQATGQEDLFS